MSNDVAKRDSNYRPAILGVDSSTGELRAIKVNSSGELLVTGSATISNNTSTQKVKVSKAGTLVGTRWNVNLIEGSGVTLTVSDNSVDDRVDVTVAVDTSTFVTLNGSQTLTNKVINGASNTISNVSLSSGITGTLPVANGGTGQTTYTDGQLLIGNTTGNTLAKATLTGTSNQVVVTNGNGSITLSTPQSIGTSSTPQFGRLGLGQAADSSAVMASTGQYFSTRFDAGNSSTALTIDFNNGNCQITTLTGNCTFTFSNPKSGGRYLLELKQDGTGSRTVTWPATVKWSGASSPTLTTTAGQTDIVTLYFNGTNYAASSTLNFAL